jgi:hypothetical protein
LRPFDLIWKACRRYAKQAERRHLDSQYEGGYRRLPEDPVVAEAQANMSAQILEQEQW